ncbi:MAG: NAD(P)/FAD-dependent oxidoreductase [Bosea sp. (in: a-proteobacteria)]
MHCDFLIIGAGISGAAAAFELAAHGSVIVLEAEAMPGYHSTGRSAALYTRNYGNSVVRRINQASHGFFTSPPDGFTDVPLLTPRGSLTIASFENRDGLGPILGLSEPGHEIIEVSAARCLELCPILRSDHVATGAFEPGVMDMDVAAIHHGFLKGLKARGGVVTCKARVEGIERKAGQWHVAAGDVMIAARIVVNAAGAWAGEIGLMAGATDVGLIPKRRTAITVDVPTGTGLSAMPAVDVIGGDGYFKPDAGRLMASPGDQTPVAPQDAQPDEWDVAVLVDWLQTQTTLEVRRIASSWAGLRSFVADETPVVGFDGQVEGFFWLAGQGGYGIMMAPALGRATASLVTKGELPADLTATGLMPANLAPERLKVLAASMHI